MTRITKGRDAAYWVHSDPNAPDDEAAEQTEDAADACPGKHRADRPEPGQPVWCREHAGEILSAVRSLPDLAASCLRGSDGTLLGQPVRSEIRSASTDPASPAPAWDAAEYVAQWASASAYTLAARINDKDPGRFRPNTGILIPHLTASVSYLANRITAWLSGDDAAVVGSQALAVEKRLRAQAGLDRLVHHLPDSCLQCGRNSLRRRDGKDFVECTNPACRARWPWEQFEFLAKAYAESEGATA